MQILKSKSLVVLRSSICPYFSSSYSFHSTPASLAKGNPSCIRFETRQKRADRKKALNDLLLNSGCSKPRFEGGRPTLFLNETSNWDLNEEDKPRGSKKKSRAKKSRPSSRGGKGKGRRNFSADFDEYPEVFEATFGNKSYTWSSRSWHEPSFRSSSAEFEWRDQSNWTRGKRRVWDSTSETDEDDDRSSIAGSYSDRTILGLPTTGPLKIEAVKSAFRSSALMWHPDKHQGSSRVAAEEKFKQCVDAYNGLCNALSSQ